MNKQSARRSLIDKVHHNLPIETRERNIIALLAKKSRTIFKSNLVA